MRRWADVLLGVAYVELTGAAQEAFLNDLTEAGLRFWKLQRPDALHLTLCIPLRRVAEAQKMALRRLCDLRTVSQDGLLLRLRGFLRRPVLILGLAAAIFLSFYLQNYVWIIEVSGNEELHSGQIVQALAGLGVRPGVRSDGLDVQLLRNRMLLQLPELSWCTVNRQGGILRVPVAERSVAKPAAPQHKAAHIVALRDGVLTEVSVYEGMKLCATGQTVRKGQVLVSAFEDYGLYLRAVCANAEIYAQTWHSGTLLCPAVQMEKIYTGEEWTEYALVIGNSRRKIGKSSSFLTDNCDRMVTVKTVELPGGSCLPVYLEITVCRAYTLQARELEHNEASAQLYGAWDRMLRSAMVGTVTQTDGGVVRSGDFYALHAQSLCNEMIAVVMPVDPAYEGERNGKNN